MGHNVQSPTFKSLTKAGLVVVLDWNTEFSVKMLVGQPLGVDQVRE